VPNPSIELKTDHHGPQQSKPGLIAGSVIGALFMVIVFGVITVMHIRERRKRINALKTEKQARIEAVSLHFFVEGLADLVGKIGPTRRDSS
jgi:hypothetical protein